MKLSLFNKPKNKSFKVNHKTNTQNKNINTTRPKAAYQDVSSRMIKKINHQNKNYDNCKNKVKIKLFSKFIKFLFYSHFFFSFLTLN